MNTQQQVKNELICNIALGIMLSEYATLLQQNLITRKEFDEMVENDEATIRATFGS